MGRHRSTLRELGWGVSNSPNPWKQGSAKRVVRTLDYSAAEVDDPPVAEPLPDSQQAAGLDDKLAQMQHDGRQQLDRIREQFEQQEAESKRKLDRLNGRIAELGEGKRAMWSAIGQGQKGGGKAEAESAAPTGTSTDASAVGAAQQQTAEGALARREAELSTKAAAVDRAEAEATAKAEAAAQATQAATARESACAEREAALSSREAALKEGEARLAAAVEQHKQREAAVAAREQALAGGAAPSEASSVKQTQQQQATHTQQAATSSEPAAAAASSSSVKEEKPDHSAADAKASAAAAAAKAGSSKEAAEEAARSKVRFDKAAAAKDAVSKGNGALKAQGSSKADAPEPKEIQCDATAEWARSENLTASLVRQRGDNPDEVFFPLPHQRTCELADIFSAPRRRERGKGSGDWTPLAPEDMAAGGSGTTRSLFANASSKEGGSASAAPQHALQLLGVEGEYMGEVLALTLPWGVGAAAKTILLGRSSSCDVTLSRDDQISRRHMQIEGRDGKLIARDLGSTYGTKVNGKALNGEPAEVKPGDVIMLGASSFQLQAVGGK